MGVVVGKDDSFATQSAYLRAANIERVAVLGQVRQRDVVVFRHETIAQSGAIYIERQVVTAAHLEDVVELLSGVKRTILGGKGDVHHRSEEHTSELQSRQYLVCRLLLEKKTQHTRSPEYYNR